MEDRLCLDWLAACGEAARTRLDVVGLAAEALTLAHCIVQETRALQPASLPSASEECAAASSRALFLLAPESGLERLSLAELDDELARLQRDVRALRSLRDRLALLAYATAHTRY